MTPRGEDRLFYVSDPSSVAKSLLPDPVTEGDLRRWVDMLADAGVDLFCQEVFSQGWTAYWKSGRYEYDRREQHKRFLPMLEKGTQPLEILIDQSHKRGMKFIAGFRMNDGHGYQAIQQGVGICDFIQSHPEWQITDGPNVTEQKPIALDFSFEEVREFTFGVIQEVVNRFDMDGLELCFRDDAYFPAGKGHERATLMTELLKKVRGLLERRGNETGRELLLGIRVPSSIEECGNLGLDVTTWIKEGIIDNICPQDRMYTDFNLPCRQWAELTRNTNCKLYPGVLPWTSHRARYRLKRNPIPPAVCRAYAHSMYQAGADGLSVYNHFLCCRHAPFYPQALQIFHQLRDPNRVSNAERHYIFDPTWDGCSIFGKDGRCSTGVMKARKLILNRKEKHPSGEYHFILYEDSIGNKHITLLFRGFGLTEHDELTVSLNGTVIPDSDIYRNRKTNQPPAEYKDIRTEDGRIIPCLPEAGRIDARELPEKPSPTFSTRWFSIPNKILIKGNNILILSLDYSDPEWEHEIVIDELEIYVDSGSLV
ncbi:MAG: family 10 glycosylhydrolase [Phycisphaerae bacterium]|nr:family 10 glycosylhydrolase [Phycisphaerae bacterium]